MHTYLSPYRLCMNYSCYQIQLGHAVAKLVEALCYKPEDRWFNSRLCHWHFYWYNPSSRTMTLGVTQPLTEISTRNNSWGKGGRCIGLTNLPPSCADCLRASNSWNAQGLSKPVMELLYLYLYLYKYKYIEIFYTNRSVALLTGYVSSGRRPCSEWANT
jgi:hypothetical protein